MGNANALAHWVDPLLAALTPGQRATLAAELARALRQTQRARIRANLNPDGSPYAPRVPQARRQSGAIKRGAMFRRIGRHIHARSNSAGLSLAFSGRVARIAGVHHYGERDRVRPGGPMADYPARELLGLSAEDRDLVQDRILHHLSRALA